MRSPINSEKHLVQRTLQGVSGGSIFNQAIIEVTNTPTASIHVPVGAVVKAVHVELWLLTVGNTSVGSTVVTVEKTIGDATDMVFAQSSSLHDYPNKKNIFYTTQGLISDEKSVPIPALKFWIKIPKGKQRFGLGDKLNINISALSEDLEFCGCFIYKAYT